MAEMKLVRDGEAVITFRTSQLMRREELDGVKMMAMATTEPFQHVMAVLGEEYIDSRGKRTGVRFRVYDNDGKRGGGVKGGWRLRGNRLARATARCTRAGGANGLVLHARAMANVRPPPAARLRIERAAQAANTDDGAVEPPE